MLMFCKITSEDFTLPDVVYPNETSDGWKINHLREHICTGDKTIVNLTIPDTYESIGHFAFYNCPNLESVYFGKNVNSIDGTAFSCCPKFKKFDVSPENPYLYEKDGCVLERETNKLVATNGNLPIETKEICQSVFAGNTNLSDIVIPNGVEIIGDYAFNMTSVETVSIPNTVKEIGIAAFASCANLKEIYIPRNVLKLGGAVFGLNEGIVINCEAESQPEGWDAEWLKNCTNYTLNWGVEPQPSN